MANKEPARMTEHKEGTMKRGGVYEKPTSPRPSTPIKPFAPLPNPGNSPSESTPPTSQGTQDSQK